MNIIKLVKIFDQITGKKNKFKKISYPKNYPGDEPLRRCPNIDKVIKDTGFKPLISVKKGIRRILEFNNIT